MLPAELVSPVTDALSSLDWYLILFVAGVVLVAYSAFVTLSGLEGWILASSLRPWCRGFLLGGACVIAGGAALAFWAMKMPRDHQLTWVVLGVAAAVGALIAARVTVVAFWKTWYLRIFILGGVLGLLVYLAGVLLMAADDWTGIEQLAALLAGQAIVRDETGALGANWRGIAKLAMAFAAGGGLYAVAYRLFYPLVWLLRNAALMAAGVILLALSPIRQALAGFLDGAARAGELRDAASQRLSYVAAVAAASCVAVAWAMWAQNFSRKFRNFSGRVLQADCGSFGLATMTAGSVATAFATLGRMLTFSRAGADNCRVLKPEEDSDDDQAENARKGGRKKAKKNRPSPGNKDSADK
ncbi:MAG: hypothetical protein ACYTF6_08925 [Planctomycetota bacterium]|jgi:hypothetical protein